VRLRIPGVQSQDGAKLFGGGVCVVRLQRSFRLLKVSADTRHLRRCRLPDRRVEPAAEEKAEKERVFAPSASAAYLYDATLAPELSFGRCPTTVRGPGDLFLLRFNCMTFDRRSHSQFYVRAGQVLQRDNNPNCVLRV
jgi:hypothetical protein